MGWQSQAEHADARLVICQTQWNRNLMKELLVSEAEEYAALGILTNLALIIFKLFRLDM